MFDIPILNQFKIPMVNPMHMCLADINFQNYVTYSMDLAVQEACFYFEPNFMVRNLHRTSMHASTWHQFPELHNSVGLA